MASNPFVVTLTDGTECGLRMSAKSVDGQGLEYTCEAYFKSEEGKSPTVVVFTDQNISTAANAIIEAITGSKATLTDHSNVSAVFYSVRNHLEGKLDEARS